MIIVSLILAIIILGGIGYWIYNSSDTVTEVPTVTNFDECAAAGYPVTQSYPRQCRTPEGDVFTETVAPVTPPAAVATGGCYIGGCSSQICSDQPDAVSTCEYRTEYSCYQTGRCERQASGSCGWTQTADLRSCLVTAANTDLLLK